VIGAGEWPASKFTVVRGATIADRAMENSVVRDRVARGEHTGGLPATHLRWVTRFDAPLERDRDA
jgi:hypothetical protein